MSNCIIQIKIGDNVITLDPNANISADDATTLSSAVDIVKLRSLFTSLKGETELSKAVQVGNPEDIYKGASLYEALKNAAPQPLTPLRALNEATNEEDKRVLRSYISSLDPTQVHSSGDFFGSPENAYKLSPYSIPEIQSFFDRDGQELSLFRELMSIPGMSTLRISIAARETLNGSPLTSTRGVYMSPDNIVQIYVPPSSIVRTAGTNKIHVGNFGKEKEAIRKNILHEVTHAVYSELYMANPDFKKSVNLIHQAFLSTMRGSTKAADQRFANTYTDVHEFMADMFVNKGLTTKLSNIKSIEGSTELEPGNLYNVFINKLSEKLRGGEQGNLLTQAITLLDTSIPSQYIGDSFDKTIDDELAGQRQAIFFNDGVDQLDINERTAPRDAGDSYGGVNAQAFYIQQKFNTRHDVKDNKYTIRDAYYYASIDNPTPSQIDRLFREDLVKIPWLRYQTGNAADAKGRWIEQGVLTKGGKDVISKGKPVTVDIVRDEKGKVIQNDSRGTISERTKLVPVVYTNSKQGKVVVAKTGLRDGEENGFNTVSIPYSLVKGYRKFNNEYFNHNEDYTTQLKKLEDELKIQKKKGESEDRTDAIDRLNKAINNTNAAIAEAIRVTEDMVAYHQETAFSHKDSESKITKMEVSREDYMNSNFKKDDIEFRDFVDPGVREPLYVINKDKDGKFRSRPNPKVFRTLWEGDSAEAYVTDSENVSEAVSRGDMIRVSVKIDIDQDGEKLSIKKNDWFPIFQRLPNGIEVATAKGKGMIIPFSKIDAYAKNITTDSFQNLFSRVEGIQNTFEDKMTIAVGDVKEKVEKRVYNKEFAKTGISYKSLKFNSDYNVKDEEAIEDAIKRFDKNQKATRDLIIPYESFVKVNRRYFDAGFPVLEDGKPTGRKGAPRDYQTTDLVIAKTDKGLLVMNTQTKYLKFEFIAYDAELTTNNGNQLAFLMQDISAASNVWDEFMEEKDSYEKMKDVATWRVEGTKESPKYVKVVDTLATPRNNRDIYDFYEDVNGKRIDMLRKGDVIGVARKEVKDGESKFYYRKVISVHDSGAVTVAEYAAKEMKHKSGFTMKAGAYPRTVQPKDILKVGYKTAAMKDGKQVLREDLLERRANLMKYAESDKDKKDFDFRSAKSALAWNAKRKPTSGSYTMFVPYTVATQNYGQKDQDGNPYMQNTPADSVYLNKKGNPLPLDSNGKPNPDDIVYINAWFEGSMLKNTVNGMAANTEMWKAEDILLPGGRRFKKIAPEVLKEIMPGDWVVRKYRNKAGEERLWSALIDRVEGGQPYVINKDNTTSVMNYDGFQGIRTSRRNDKLTGFTRSKRLAAFVKEKVAERQPVKVTASIDADYKSPADSARAIYEVGSRFQSLNPDVKVNYLTSGDLDGVRKALGFDYANAKAFILNGEVNINMENASVSDLIHEYAHLYLHALKYENTEMYNAITSMTMQHPLYSKVSDTYSHLEGEDLNEEVFVTVLGEYLNGQLKKQDEAWTDGKKDLIINFAEYTKRKLSQTMNQEIGGIYDLDAKDILTMNFEDVINLVGDEVMKNRISNLYDVQVKFNRTLERLKQDLMKRNQLTQECYG